MSAHTASPQNVTHDASHQLNFANRWKLLTVFCIAQVMVVLDATIVNVAMPALQADLGFSSDNRQWLITGYALAFGSLLLLGGRIGDRIGRKNLLKLGIIGFAAASALGGLALNFDMIVIARVLQGVFGAAMAPAALGLLTSVFHGHQRDRAKAFGIYGAVAGAGGTLGLILGGFLTQYIDWRWCLLVNVPLALVTVLGAQKFLAKDPVNRDTRIDVLGAVVVTVGLFCLVFAIAFAETHGWVNGLTLGLGAVAIVLLALFVAQQRRSKHPLLPLNVVVDRTRGGGYLSFFLVCVGMFGIFFFVSQYLFEVREFTPVQTGFSFIPMTIPMILVSTYGTSLLLPRFGPRNVVVAGMAVAALGALWMAQLQPDSSYALLIAPALFTIGLGAGTVFAPAIAIATNRVHESEAGVAAALVNMSQQIGGSIGTALLASILASSSAAYGASHATAAAGVVLTHSLQVVFYTVAGVYLIGAIAAALLFRAGPLEADSDD
ncbi:MFS transporter [Micrococcales bacterium 31B]|nr:MFS transporter [Micrococcales bacterium 31B]